ncbi:MAG: GH25 family lysozyme [Sphingopyxis sp.]
MTGAATPSLWRKGTGRAAMGLCLLIVALLGWRWWSTHWRPGAAEWPTQGVAIGAENDPVSWPALATQGISFAYIDATRGARQANPHFSRDHDAALPSGLHSGAIHQYRLCERAMDQAAAFVRLVPREATSLPPLVTLDLDDNCAAQPSRALLLSELSTFLTQLETHMGKSAFIAPSAEFEERYDISSAIVRGLMVHSPRSEPDADDPTWVLWLANDQLRIAGSDGPTRLLVLSNSPRGANP